MDICEHKEINEIGHWDGRIGENKASGPVVECRQCKGRACLTLDDIKNGNRNRTDITVLSKYVDGKIILNSDFLGK